MKGWFRDFNIFKQTKKRSYKTLPVPDSVWKNPLHFIAFGLGSGAMPFAPGTFGTLMSIPFYFLIRDLSPIYYLITLLLIIIGSMWLCDKVSKEIKIHDHPGMCLDEFVGFFVTMFLAPHGIVWIVIGFILFRLFDIWKPWPIRQMDHHVKGGVGIILDDVLAGIYSCIFLQFLYWLTLR